MSSLASHDRRHASTEYWRVPPMAGDQPSTAELAVWRVLYRQSHEDVGRIRVIGSTYRKSCIAPTGNQPSGNKTGCSTDRHLGTRQTAILNSSIMQSSSDHLGLKCHRSGELMASQIFSQTWQSGVPFLERTCNKSAHFGRQWTYRNRKINVASPTSLSACPLMRVSPLKCPRSASR